MVKALIVIDISYVFWSWMGVYQYDETGVSADFFTSAFAQASENSPILKIFTLFRFIPNPESSSFYTCRLAQSD